jgi:hypothetical protein
VIRALAALLLAASRASAENLAEAGSSAPWTKLDAGARSAGFSGAICAVPGDAFALFVNPAGLSEGSGTRGGVSHTSFVLGIRAEDFAASRSAGSGRIGFAFRYVDLGRESQRTLGGIEGPVFGATGYSASLGYAGSGYFSGRVRAGAALKMISATTFYSRDVSGAVDAGAIGTLVRNEDGGEAVRAGLSLLDLGPGFGDTWLSTRLRIGIAATTAKGPGAENGVTAALDVEVPRLGAASVRAGAEYGFGGIAFARVGYFKRLSAQAAQDGDGGPTAGIGLTLRGFSLDYAYAAMGTLGGTHRVGVTYGMGVEGR